MSFSTTTTCSMSQVAFILNRSQSGAPTGTYGSHTISCPGTPAQQPPGTVASWAVNGDRFSISVNQPQRVLSGTVSGSTVSGTFTWLSMTGTFSGVRQ